MKMLFVLTIATILGVHSCSPGKKAAQDPVESAHQAGVTLIQATGQRWTAGIQGGGSGTEYTFKVAINTATPIQFGTVDLGGKARAVLVARHGSAISTTLVVPQQGDTLNLRVSVNNEVIPIAEGATIHYTDNSIAQQLLVPRIEKLAPLNRP